MENPVKLQDFVQRKIKDADFKMYEDSTKGIIKLMIISTHQEYAYDFLKIMMNDTRREYTADLYPGIVQTEFYDFDFAHFKENGAVIFDVKNFVPRDVVDARL